MMRNWKTTLLGVLGGLFMLFGPRLQGNATAPPITIGNVGAAAAVALLGALARDHDNTDPATPIAGGLGQKAPGQ